ncbi:MAG TPA: FtsX-like permease family protein [Gemmatimonadales bacterium]|nr:FtsX-like permease family protein [Gemmatimonadales bacterium]
MKRRSAPGIIWHATTDGLRMYWRGVAVTAVAGMAAVAATTVVAATLTGAATTRLALSTMRGGDLGLAWNDVLTTTVTSLQQTALAGLSGILVAITVGVLIVAAVTVLAVASARAAQRAVEVQVRRAVGASRRQLLGAALAEGGVIAAATVVIGGSVGGIAARAALRAWPGQLQPWSAVPLFVLAGATASVIVAGALFTLIPARGRAVRETSGRTPALHAIALQLGLSVLVLTMGSLLIRHAGAMATPRGTGPGDATVLEIDSSGTPMAERAARYAALLDATRRSGLYDVVSLASPGTAAGLGPASKITTDCGECMLGTFTVRWQVTTAVYHFVSADTFRAVSAPLTAGRGILDTDRWDAPRVVVVNRALAREHFQHGDAVGRRLQLGTGQQWYTVVGIVDDPARSGFGAVLEPRGAVYLSVLQVPPAAVDLTLRPVHGAAVDGEIARRAADILQLPDHRVARTTAAALATAELAPLAWFGRWIGAEGWAMLLIAITGTFALMQLWVASLRREIGVRRAAGARRGAILRLVLRRGCGAAAGGMALALWFGPAARDALATAVAGLPDADPLALLRYGALLSAIALVGALLPAWHAAHAAPAELVAAVDS